MQRRKPAARDGTVSRTAARDQALGDLDDTRIVHLVYLRSAAVESVSQLDARTRRRVNRGNVRAEQSAHGSNCVALGVRLVFDGPTRVAFRDTAGAECEPRTRSTAWMGTRVRFVLDVLAAADRDYGSGVMVVGTVFMEYLASTPGLSKRQRGGCGAIRSMT